MRAELIFDVELLDVATTKRLAAAVDILVPLQGLETRLPSLAEAIPDDKYGWRAAPDARIIAVVC